MKVILMVLDSLGIGASDDAKNFGDEGANTFFSIVEKYPQIDIPNLKKIGFGNIDGLKEKGCGIENPVGIYGRLKELSLGKDTTTGHWEMVGIETVVPFKTYPDGFPREFIEVFEKRINRKTIGNYPSSGIKIINDLGEEHEKSGDVIVYTSADSVFQIAVNIDIISLEELYSICEIARELLVGEWACARVIARPYKFIDGERKRTADRKDYSVSPPEKTLLDYMIDENRKVYGVGKISDIFNGVGISDEVHTKSNMAGVDETINAIKLDFDGLIFTNLVDFDSEFGHRRDPVGYGKAIENFDKRIPEIIDAMNKEDILILTADHGNDPTFKGSDHTREYVPGLFISKGLWESKEVGVNIGTRDAFADIGATIGEIFNVNELKIGKPIKEVINLTLK